MKKLVGISWSYLIAGLAVTACDAQVGEDYTGEVLLSLHGTVLIEDPNQADKVPALMFPHRMAGAVVVDLDIDGEYPSGFGLRVTEPPPADADQIPHGGTEQLWVAHLVLVSPEHERVVPTGYFENDECEDLAGEGSCAREERVCPVEESLELDPEGCFIRESLCEVVSCDVVEALGDETIAGDNELLSSHCGETCDTFVGRCSEAGDCYVERRECEVSGPGNLSWGGDALACDVEAESGDRMLLPYLEAAPVATNYFLVYAQDEYDIPWLGGHLARGYNLIEALPFDIEDVHSVLLCRSSGSWVSSRSGPDAPELDPDGNPVVVCDEPPYYRVVEQPDAEPLQIRLGSEASLKL